jgi:solute carrier family 25 2-oxodicarboxylate transporter 21
VARADPARAELPFYATFTAGAVAGISEILTFYPLGPPPPVCARSTAANACLAQMSCVPASRETARMPRAHATPRPQVKTRLQLDVGKSKHGLVGTFKDIVATEGCARPVRVSVVRVS